MTLKLATFPRVIFARVGWDHSSARLHSLRKFRGRVVRKVNENIPGDLRGSLCGTVQTEWCITRLINYRENQKYITPKDHLIAPLQCKCLKHPNLSLNTRLQEHSPVHSGSGAWRPVFVLRPLMRITDWTGARRNRVLYIQPPLRGKFCFNVVT